MEDQGHIFIFYLIFFWLNMQCQGMLHSMNSIFNIYSQLQFSIGLYEYCSMNIQYSIYAQLAPSLQCDF